MSGSSGSERFRGSWNRSGGSECSGSLPYGGTATHCTGMDTVDFTERFPTLGTSQLINTAGEPNGKATENLG